MICFDTGPLIWGVQGQAHAGQEQFVERTKRYIRSLSREKKTIMIPAPVVAEYLIGIPTEKHVQHQELIEKLFYVPSFDLKAARIAAEIENDKALMTAIRNGEQLDRQRLRVDVQILATAITNNADMVISNDPHMPTLAGARIKVVEVPEVAEQIELL